MQAKGSQLLIETDSSEQSHTLTKQQPTEANASLSEGNLSRLKPNIAN